MAEKKRKRKARALFWVLADSTKKRTNFFREWTGIGPRGTRNLREAKRFRTRREALASRASAFLLMFYEPMPIRKAAFERCEAPS